MGLFHLDAEDVILPSSAYKSTAEGKSATKKSHKTKKSADFGGFQLIQIKKLQKKLFLLQNFYRDFCSALNETAPLCLC